MLPFWASDAVLIGVQASLVALPVPAVPRALGRLRATGWALVLPVSLGGTIALLALAPAAANVYSWLALAALPLLSVHTLRSWPFGRAGGSDWVWAAATGVALFLLAWAGTGLAGQGAAVVITALSCLSLAAALGALAPSWALKAGIVVMAVLDAILVFGQLLEGPNEHLNAAAPSAGLPQLQTATFGSALVGYGDFFIAAVLAVVLAQELLPRRRVFALCTLACSAAFDALFVVVHVLPATVPVAATLVISEYVRRRGSGTRANRSRTSIAAPRGRG